MCVYRVVCSVCVFSFALLFSVFIFSSVSFVSAALCATKPDCLFATWIFQNRQCALHEICQQYGYSGEGNGIFVKPDWMLWKGKRGEYCSSTSTSVVPVASTGECLELCANTTSCNLVSVTSDPDTVQGSTKDVVVEWSRYDGYAGDIVPEGTVELSYGAEDVSISWTGLVGDPLCSSGVTCTGSNCCGIHIHDGTSCAAAGGHFFKDGESVRTLCAFLSALSLYNSWILLMYFSFLCRTLGKLSNMQKRLHLRPPLMEKQKT